VGQTIAPAVLLGLLSAGTPWLWTTTIGVCLIIVLGIDYLTPGPPLQAPRDANGQ
jgi:hypothetical protein